MNVFVQYKNGNVEHFLGRAETDPSSVVPGDIVSLDYTTPEGKTDFCKVKILRLDRATNKLHVSAPY